MNSLPVLIPRSLCIDEVYRVTEVGLSLLARQFVDERIA